MAHVELTAEALQGYFADAGAACPFVSGGTRFAAWQLGRIFAELGREMPLFVRVLDASHLEADGVGYQIQVLDEQQLVALIPVETHTAPPAHLARENAECRPFQLT